MRSKLGLLVASLLTIPLISAQTWGRYGSPFDSFDNEWVKFTIVLLVLFFLIYYFVHKKTDNTPVSVIVGLGIALLLTIALTKRGILDNFLEETIVDWVLIIAVLFVIFFLFYKLAFKEDMYGYRRFSLWRFIFALILIALIPLFIELEEILPESLMYGPFLDFIELLQGFSSFIFIGLGVLIIIWILWKIKNLFSGRRRGYGRRWGRDRRQRRGWGQRRRDRRTTQQPQRPRSFRQTIRGAKRTNRQAEQRANRADWARKEDIRKHAVAGKWKSRAMIVQKRDAEKQAARQAREQTQRQAEQERAQKAYAKQQEKARAIAEQKTRREQEKVRIITQKQIVKESIVQKRDTERQAREQAQRQAEQERAQRIRLEQIRKRNIIEGRRAEAERNKSYKEKLKQERLMYARKDKKVSREQELRRQQEEHNRNIKGYIGRRNKKAIGKSMRRQREKQEKQEKYQQKIQQQKGQELKRQ